MNLLESLAASGLNPIVLDDKPKVDLKAVCITALNILDGMNVNEHWDGLQESWEEAGFGFIEFCDWITDIAIESERTLLARLSQNFPGVYDYEVSCSLGEQIRNYMLRESNIPEDALWKDWLKTLQDDFFAQGDQS